MPWQKEEQAEWLIFLPELSIYFITENFHLILVMHLVAPRLKVGTKF